MSYSDTSSNSSSKSSIKRIFTKKYIYPEWFTDTDFKFLQKKLSEIKKLRFFHARASEHFNNMNYYIFGPSITITAISGVASFLSTSTLVEPEVKSGFGISVGVLASISTMLQSIGSSCKFSAKADAHRMASEEYSKLITRIKFEMDRPNEEEFCNDLESKILEIQNKCNYFVPQFIIDNYYKYKNLNKKKHTSYGTFDSTLKKENSEKSKPIGSPLVTNTQEYEPANSVLPDENISIKITEESTSPSPDVSTGINGLGLHSSI